MIEVKEALAIIARNTVDFGNEKTDLYNSFHRVLREEWRADRPLPPFDRVTMDGIAILFATYAEGLRRFAVSGVAAAGAPRMSLDDPRGCLEVMTGAVLPLNCDTVIPYEHLDITDDFATILEPVTGGQNIHRLGEDRKAGDIVARPDTLITAAEIGVAASIGQVEVTVARLPRVMVISTGDELVEVDQHPLPHQIRRSNVFYMLHALRAYSIVADAAHLADDRDQLTERLSAYIRQYDVILFSGGVSMGKFDFLPEVLKELGVEQLFHKVRQRPGKPFWFGRHGAGCTVFGFPGNPVSSFLCYQRYFTFWMDRCLRLKTVGRPTALLTEAVIFRPSLTYFMEVCISYDDRGQILATPCRGNGSGDLANLVSADAFIALPADRDHFAAGEAFPIYGYR